ncbi:fumarylacetoacetate hydrolase family protein [Neptunomonas sp.]|uniref:fumarylacetoacetate hydrolase family protein n=1 Tax=Neptunomonas TaxID=75687 RepID=UPI003515B515
MAFQHCFTDGRSTGLCLGKIVCVGRNYADHAKELNNPIPTEPLLFIKPSTSAVTMEQSFAINEQWGSVHYETELAILIGETLTHASEAEVASGIAGAGLALDLTIRDVQSKLKEKGQPWERAKAFDGSCPLSVFVPIEQIDDLQNIQIQLQINGEMRQDGNSSMMLNKVVPLISEISQLFTLEPGDVVITGTPAGVGQLNNGDQLVASLVDLLRVETTVEG